VMTTVFTKDPATLDPIISKVMVNADVAVDLVERPG
jgi:hypothetical protein